MADSPVIGFPVGPRWKIKCKDGKASCEISDGGENRTTSLGQVEMRPIMNLKPGATTLSGKHFFIKDSVPLSSLASCKPFSPNSSITSRCFNQSQAYQSLDRFLTFIGKVIAPIESITYDRQKRAFYPIEVIVDEPGLDNAFFSDVSRNLTFGDGEGRLSYASDGGIIWHEAGHWIIWTINWLLASDYFGAGLAIHEGLADIFAVLFSGNPIIGEDIRHNRTPGGPVMPYVRNANNIRKFPLTPEDSTDPHDVGEIYSGFFCSLYKRIRALLERANPPGQREHANDGYDIRARLAVFKIALSSLDRFKAPNPDHADFPGALKEGFSEMWDAKQEIMAELQHHNVSKEAVLKEIDAELSRRGFVTLVAKRDAEEQNRRREERRFGVKPLARPAFDKPVEISRTAGVFLQQLYPTRMGPAAVLGHGIIKRNNTTFENGVRRIESNEIDGTVNVTHAAALQTAQRAIRESLPEAFARFHPHTRLSEKSKQKFIAMALKNCTQGRLAILPAARGLSWTFNAWPLLVSVNAKTGEADVMVKGMID